MSQIERTYLEGIDRIAEIEKTFALAVGRIELLEKGQEEEARALQDGHRIVQLLSERAEGQYDMLAKRLDQTAVGMDMLSKRLDKAAEEVMKLKTRLKKLEGR